MPIVEARIKKYFPTEIENMHTTVTETVDSENVLLKTIKISKNLFSLTERLPKPRYKGGNY